MNSMLHTFARLIGSSGRSRRGMARSAGLAAERLEVRTLLTAAPVASVPDMDAASDTGWSNVDNKTSISTPVFSGSATPGAVSVNIFDGKRLIGSAPVAEGVNRWVFTAPALADGRRSIAAQAVDVTGRTGRISRPLSVEIRSAAPAAVEFALAAASDTGIKGDNRTNVAAPRIAGRGVAGTAVMVWVDDVSVGTAVVGARGTWSFQLPTLAEGTHTVSTAVSNVFGLQSGFTTRTVVIDTVRPTVELSYVPETGSIVMTFSRPVTGVSLKGLRIVGNTESGLSFDLPLSDANVRNRVGAITITRSPDFTTHTLRTQRPLREAGAYILTLNAARSGIVDALAGNRLLGDATLTVLM